MMFNDKMRKDDFFDVLFYQCDKIVLFDSWVLPYKNYVYDIRNKACVIHGTK